MEYYQYFRLDGPPFQPAAPDGAVYFSPTHLQGLATLEAGLAGDLNGLTLLTGEAGTGKTTLIYSLLQRDFKRVRIAHIDDPKLSFLEIMRVILAQLNLYCAGSTKLDYLKTLDHLLELHGKEERIAIVVDESQVLSDDVLEELRLLWNRGQRNDTCLLQVILVGQPELAERLKKPELRQLNQRISSRGVLRPLNLTEGIMYVECRLSAQGGKCATIFEPRALNHLLRCSDGIPRKINMLCHNAMVAGFHALERKVSFSTAKKVAAEYQQSVGITYRRSRARRLLMPMLAVGAASLLLLGFRYRHFWPGWVRNRIVAFGGPADQALEPLEIVERAQAAKHLKTVEPAGVQGHPDSGAKPKAATDLAPHPVELRASSAPGAAAPAAPKSDATGPATAPGIPLFSTASAAAAVSAGIPKQTGVPAAPQQRSQITVRDGDTLEEIAIRYFGSKSGIDQLVKANPQLTNINQLTVGQIIYLPPGITPKASHHRIATARPVSNGEDSPE
jgi:general secretion pathway protein A